MDETYDVWVDYGYDGYDFEFNVDHTRLLELIDKCELNARAYFVYKTKDRQID